MIRFIFITILAFIFSITHVNALDKSQPSWNGIYNYNSYGGRDAGGIAIFLDISVSISPSGECKIIRQGYQIMDSMNCLVRKKDNSIDIMFKSYPGGKSVNEYGVAEFKPSDRLFSLTLNKKNDSIVTEWGKLKPEGYAKGNKGNFFKRKY